MLGSIEDRKRRYFLVLGAIVLLAMAIDAPMVGITFVGDDALRANIDGWIAAHNTGLLGAFRSEIFQEDLYRGRFHPLFIALTLMEMHLVHQPLVLKLAQLFAVGLNVATFAFVVREVLGSRSRALLAALLAVFMLQMRNVTDATNGDSLHLQMTLECGLLAIGLLAVALRSRGPASWASYAASVLAFAGAILLYEVAIPLIAPLALICLLARRTWFARAALALPFLMVLVADVGAILLIRQAWPPLPGQIYAPNFGLDYAYAIVWQIVSTLPLLYQFADPQAVFHATNTYWPFAILAAIAAIGIVGGWLLTRSARETVLPPPSRGGVAVAIVTGLALLAPALIVTASPVYQKVIQFALPYAPVYIQGFGLALIVAALLPLRRLSPVAGRALAASGIAIFLVLFASNVVVAGQFDSSKFARRTIVDGLMRDAAAGIPSGAWVFLDDSYYWVNGNSYYGVDEEKIRGPLLWDSKYFYRLWAGRTWQTRPLSAQRLNPGEGAYEIRSARNGPQNGTLVVESVRGRAAAPPELLSAKIFERGAPMTAPLPPAIASAFAPGDFNVVDGGSNWRVTEFHSRCAALPDDALVADAPSAAQIVYGDGFSVAETDGTMRWHWAGRQATLSLVNPTDASFDTELRAAIGTIGGARGVVNVTWAGGAQRVHLGSQPQAVRIRARLPARGLVEIQFAADAPNVAIAGDSRDLRFRAIDAVLADAGGC